MNYVKELWHKFVTHRNIAYLFINIGNIPIMTLVSSFLAVYYVNVLGMDEYAVGTMFFVARLFDGINDPIIGGIIDKIKGNKLSKFKRILVLGTVLCALNYLVLWIGPAVVSMRLKLIFAYVSYLLLGITFPIMDISLNGLLPVLTKDRAERDTLSSIKIIGYGIGTVFIEIFVPIVLSISGVSSKTYIAIVIVFTVMVVVFSIGGAAELKNTSVKTINNEGTTNRKVGCGQGFLNVLKERNVWSTFLSGICFYTGNAVLAVSNTYYVTYYLGDVKYLAYVTIATYSLELFVILLIPKFTKKMGTKKLFVSGLLAAGLGVLLRFFSWDSGKFSFLTLMISSAVFGLGYGFVMILFYSIQADNVDKVYEKTGIQAEGTIASLMSMVNKFGKGMGGAIPLYILGLMKTTDGTYSELSLRVIDGLIPAILFICSGVLFSAVYMEE